MNRASLIFKQKLISIIFIIIALIGGVLIYFYISNLKSLSALNQYSNEVLIAKEEIVSGSEIKPEMIGRQKISNNIFSSKFVSNENEITGKTAKETILKGEIISKDKIAGIDDLSQGNLKFSTYIPSKEKAVTIPVIYWGDASLINIGDSVDVISTYYEKDSSSLKSEIVLNKEEIIIISQLSDKKDESSVKDEGLAVLNFESNSIKDNSVLYLTFYLNEEEIIRIFSAVEKGNLNIALCSSKIF